MLLANAATAESTTDSALWSGGLFIAEKDKSLDYSVEYQVRIDDHMSSLNSHFLELMKYRILTDSILINGGYRFTVRPDNTEHRLYVGGFWDIAGNTSGPGQNPDQYNVVLQVGYQHDFNAEIDDQLIGSNSIRWIILASRPVGRKVAPFFLAGVLATWNDAYSFGIDKIRLGGGLVIPMTDRVRLRSQYIWEEARFNSPKKHTNIFWLRLEMNLGQ